VFAAGEDLAEGRLVISVGRAGGGDTGGETGGQTDGEGSDGETTQKGLLVRGVHDFSSVRGCHGE